jgi:hypothetical protein
MAAKTKKDTIMPKLMTTIAAAAALAVSLTALPASAASINFGGAQVQDAQFSFGFSTGNTDRGFSRRGDYYYYNGHRGYRDRRDGFRFYNGYWFPNSAFSFGFSVDGRDRGWDRGRGRDRMGNWDRHVAWCQDRYKSYRESDNTFQPYNGSRQECVSPYSR